MLGSPLVMETQEAMKVTERKTQLKNMHTTQRAGSRGGFVFIMMCFKKKPTF